MCEGVLLGGAVASGLLGPARKDASACVTISPFRQVASTRRVTDFEASCTMWGVRSYSDPDLSPTAPTFPCNTLKLPP